jgi:protein involved in polysaccharide export with SLBB domain
MRPVSGFDRPGVQWSFIVLGLVLIAVAGGQTAALLRARAEIRSLQAEILNNRNERDQLESRAAREQSARESLSLELARQRGAATVATEATLTLAPLRKRGAQPPDPTVARPADNQSIQLRLVLPAGTEPANARYTIAVRTWTGGDTVWSRAGASLSTVDHKRMVTSYITGDVFSPGAYEIALTRRAGEMTAEIASYEVGIR